MVLYCHIYVNWLNDKHKLTIDRFILFLVLFSDSEWKSNSKLGCGDGIDRGAVAEVIVVAASAVVAAVVKVAVVVELEDVTGLSALARVYRLVVLK